MKVHIRGRGYEASKADSLKPCKYIRSRLADCRGSVAFRHASVSTREAALASVDIFTHHLNITGGEHRFIRAPTKYKAGDNFVC